MFPTMFQTETLVTGQDAATVTGLLSSVFQSPSLRYSLISSSTTQVLPLLVFPPAHHLQSNTAPTVSSGSILFTIQNAQIILNHQLPFTSLVKNSRGSPGIAFCVFLQHWSSWDATQLDGAILLFPVHRGISGRFSLRRNLLYLPSTFS